MKRSRFSEVSSPLSVRAVCSWEDLQGLRHHAECKTRDISPGGMFLLSPTWPPVGNFVVVEAFLPPFSSAVPAWQIGAQGRVVRVEPARGAKKVGGFVVATERPIVRVMEHGSQRTPLRQ
jgi:hypothetical protein